MRVNLKPLNEQVVLITGASSGIGRVTARRAAKEGAKVILVARNEQALAEAVHEIVDCGGDAIFAVADVADEAQLRQAALVGVEKFGRIDTWVNNAGVGLYGRIDQVDIADDRRLFETNFWGMVNGSRLALRHLRQNGGALINVGSELSDRAVPLQGMYSASKHAIKGFTDSLRMESEEARLPISVTLIKPSAIDTPYTRHARNYTSHEPALSAPVYSPDLVADQILHAAVRPVRELFVGGVASLMASLSRTFPRAMDKVMERAMYSQLADRPADHGNESLHESRGGHGEHGDAATGHMIRTHSLYGAASRQPFATAALAFGIAAAAAYLMARGRGYRSALRLPF